MRIAVELPDITWWDVARWLALPVALIVIVIWAIISTIIMWLDGRKYR